MPTVWVSLIYYLLCILERISRIHFIINILHNKIMLVAIFSCSCLFEFRDTLLLYLWLNIFIRGIIFESESLIIKLLNLQRFKYSLFNIIMISLFLFLCPLLIIFFHIIQLLPFKLLSAVHKKFTNNSSIYPSLDNIYLSVKVLFFRRLINNYCIFFTVYLFISYEKIKWAIEIISSILTIYYND